MNIRFRLLALFLPLVYVDFEKEFAVFYAFHRDIYVPFWV